MNATRETTLAVDGMSCPSCIRHIDEALRDVSGVQGVEVKLNEGKVRVRHDEAAEVTSLVEALRDAGYESKPEAA